MTSFHWWRTLFPLHRTSQDKFLDEAIRLANQSKTSVILTAPRGIRKSFCALRRAHRVNVFIQKAVLIDGADSGTIEQFFSAAAKVPPLRRILGKMFGDLASPAIVAFLLGVVALLIERSNQKGAVKKDGPSNRAVDAANELQEKVSKEEPSLAAIICCFFSAVFAIFIFIRMPVIIFDDPLSRISKLTNVGSDGRRRTLDEVRKIGEKRPVVILSSNEGLEKCFDDRAPMLHMHMTFPYAQPTEFVTALKAAVEEKHKNTQLTEGEREELKRLVEGLTEQQLKELLNTIPKRYIKGAYHMLYDILIIQCGGIHTLYVFFFYILRAFYL